MTNDVSASIKDAVGSAIKETGFVDSTAEGGGGTTSESDAPVTEATEETSADKEKLVATEEKVEETDDKTEPVKVEEKSKDEDEEDLRLSAEELEIIDKNPELKKVYRGMVRANSRKGEVLANKRKEADNALQLMSAFRDKPAETLRAMAAALNIKLVEEAPPAAPPAEKTNLEKIRASLEAKVGKEAAEILAPSILEAVSSVIGEEMAPVKQTLQDQVETANRHSLRSAVSAFASETVEGGGEWNADIEKEMAQMLADGKVLPGKGATLPEFLGILYNQIQTKRGQTKVVTEKITRLKKAAEVSEPVRSTKPQPPAEPVIRPGMNIKEATALAINSARKEISAR